MKQGRAYLDHNATTSLRPGARDAMVDALSQTGNASSVHTEGRAIRAIIEQSRSRVAELAGTAAANVIFTSGATEAAHLALSPKMMTKDGELVAGRLYVLATEHPCVMAGGRFDGDTVTGVPVLSSGLIDLEALDMLLDSHDNEAGPPLVAVQLVNSETGVVQPVAQVAARVRKAGGYLFCDAAQAAGRFKIDIEDTGADFMILSAHKMGGPQGSGALILGSRMVSVDPVLRGGGQEQNRRAGTESAAIIAGFGAAAREAAKLNEIVLQTGLRDSILAGMLPICADNALPAVRVFGSQAPRVGNTLLFSLPGLKAETALIAFDLEGIAVSSGSACSSGKVGASHVLAAMDVEKSVADGAVRVSLGWDTNSEDVDRFLAAFETIAGRLAATMAPGMAGAA